MGAGRVRVLTHVPLAILQRAADEVPGVEWIGVAGDEELPPALHGDVLLTDTWGAPNLKAVAACGVRWIHAFGTGVDRFPFEDLGSLHGRTLGLVGRGGIGSAVAARALPFGMRVRALRRTRKPSPIPAIEMAQDRDDLVASADHLVLAASATPATRHLLDRTTLRKVEPGVHLVNIARGSLVDQEALREALDDGRVARASLDTVEPEPLPAGPWLYAHPKVRLSPHTSSSTPGALDRLLDPFIADLRRFRAGEPLAGGVDPEAGY
jgi:phosphoglycerate dehydrogenase-like enzyme